MVLTQLTLTLKMTIPHTAQVVETTTVLFRSMFTWTIVSNLPTSCFYCQYDLMFAGPKIPNHIEKTMYDP